MPHVEIHNNASSLLADNLEVDDEPTSGRLRGGLTPPADEWPAISSTIRDHPEDVEAIDQDITHLQESMARLGHKHSASEPEISRQTRPFSPIQRLPNEILGEIMLFGYNRVGICSSNSGVWKLERVCKKWHDVAVSLQTMWTTIVVFLSNVDVMARDDMPTSILQTTTRLLHLCLQRSGDRTLSIELTDPTNVNKSHFLCAFNLLAEVSHRWGEMSFSSYMLPGSPIPKSGFPCLRTLSLLGSHDAEETFNTFKDAQRLSHLRLSGITSPFCKFNLPWSQLTRLETTCCDFAPGEYINMLEKLPNLVEFISQGSMGCRNAHQESKPVLLARLTTIGLFTNPSEICTVFLHVIAPFLTTVRLGMDSYFGQSANSYAQMATSVVSAIRTSKCSLTTLSLSTFDDASVSLILKDTPSLTHLELSLIDGIEDITLLISRPDRCIPLLESFMLTYDHEQDEDTIWGLMSMIKARSRCDAPPGALAGPRLHQVHITLKDKAAVEHFSTLLQPLSVRTGVAITIRAFQTT